MRTVRRFKLFNSKNQYLDLTSEHYFATAPTGLGFTKTTGLLRMGDDYKLVDSLVNLDTKTFEILIDGQTNAYKYQYYQDLITFLSFKPIFLMYQRPNEDKWFRQEVEVTSLTKTEVSSDDSYMHCQITMQALSFWEDDIENVIKTGNVIETGKSYPITYPIQYGGNALTNIRINSTTMIETPLKITIEGRINDPYITIADSNDVTYGKSKFIGTFDKVFINSRERDEEVELTYNDLILDNPMGYQDLSVGNANNISVTFLKVKTGQNRLQLLAGIGFTGTIELRWRNRYVSV